MFLPLSAFETLSLFTLPSFGIPRPPLLDKRKGKLKQYLLQPETSLPAYYCNNTYSIVHTAASSTRAPSPISPSRYVLPRNSKPRMLDLN